MIAPREMLLDGGVDDLLARLHRSTTVERRGRLVELLGTTMKVTGIAARIGETCEVVVPATGDAVIAEVVGIAGPYVVHLGNVDLRIPYGIMAIITFSGAVSVSSFLFLTRQRDWLWLDSFN